ncbi:hypothetical protein [Bacillus paranthracis]|uniref:hypothetical protein n=1 Tax=Bacillus paranthracis TaxID=2026186 RepID=UPI001E362856|nr:hypothetical protein [Bacillus paranthracis]
MLYLQDLTGQVFDMITVLEFSHKTYENKKYRSFWKCKCECGKEFVRRTDQIKTKRGYKSCGCYRKMITKKLFEENNPNKTHGLSNTRLYKVYRKIIERCYYEKYEEFHLYGGRGIKMCDIWRNDFTSFYNWAMENGYNDQLSIDRIDYNGNYEPNNCRWADNITQGNNKRNNIVLTHNGLTMTLPEWARHLNLPYSTLANRRKKGKTVAEILDPVKKR